MNHAAREAAIGFARRRRCEGGAAIWRVGLEAASAGRLARRLLGVLQSAGGLGFLCAAGGGEFFGVHGRSPFAAVGAIYTSAGCPLRARYCERTPGDSRLAAPSWLSSSRVAARLPSSSLDTPRCQRSSRCRETIPLPAPDRSGTRSPVPRSPSL